MLKRTPCLPLSRLSIFTEGPEVYHGTFKRGFDRLDPAFGELGTHYGPLDMATNNFATSDSGEVTGRVFRHYIEDSDTLRVRDLRDWAPESVYAELLDKNLNMDISNYHSSAGRLGDTISTRGITYQEKWRLLRQVLLNNGYKGLSYINRYEGFSGARELMTVNRRREEILHNWTDSQFLAEYPDAPVCYIIITPSGELVRG